MGWEYTTTSQVMSTLVDGRMICFMERAPISSSVENASRGNSVMEKRMAMESILMSTEMSIKDLGLMIKSRAAGHTFTQ